MVKNEEKKVVIDNRLITDVIAKMDVVPMKIFELIVSAIDSNNPPRDNFIYLSKKEVFSFFNADDKNKEVRFREHFKNLHKQTVFEEKIENGTKRNRVMSPFRFTEWYDDEDKDTITILIEENFMPYLIDLKNNFTQYRISDIGLFKRKYTILLYRWLMMKWNQYLKYGNFQLQNPKLTIKELRELTDTKKKYSKWQHFEEEVIKKSVQEINENSHISISYDLIKKGRSYSEIQFYMEAKAKKTNKTLEYLEEKKNSYEERYEANLNERINKLELFPVALTNGYVAFLIRQELIDFQNVDKVVEAYEELMPLYRQMDELKGAAHFEAHVRYVRSHMVESSVRYRNVIEYLKTAAEQYLYKLENQQ